MLYIILGNNVPVHTYLIMSPDMIAQSTEFTLKRNQPGYYL